MFEELENIYTGVVYDTLRDMGVTNCVISYDIKPIYPVKKLYGQIWTCEGQYDSNVSMEDSLSSWAKMLSTAPSNNIIICSANNSMDKNLNYSPKISHMGELSAEVLKNKGILGFITDGGTRDVEFLEAIQLPIFCSYETPKDIVGNWKITKMAEKITINSSPVPDESYSTKVEINNGDIFLYDRDGIVVIPSNLYTEVVKLANDKSVKENAMRQSILGGMDPYDAYKKYGIF
jgi:regulator of RNase E activity RraA